MDENPWLEVGKRLGGARRRASLSKREAARRAGISEITWRNYEEGVSRPAKGVVLPVNPSDDHLEAAARAVGLDPAPLFELVGRPYEPGPQPTPAAAAAALSGKFERLSPRDRALIERMVDDMLGADE